MRDAPKILVVARWPVGGIRTYLRYVHSTSVLGGYQYLLLCTDAKYLQGTLRQFRAADFVVSTVPEDGSGFSSEINKVIRQWRPNLVHSHGFTSAMLASPHAGLRRIPHLVTSHDVLFARQFRGYKGVVKKLGLGWSVRAAKHVMAVGHDALENLRTFYPELRRPNRSSAVRNGIDVEMFAGGSLRDVRGELEVGREPVLLGFFGRFMAQKGFDLLVDAVEKVRGRGRDVQVACFGWGGFIREEQQALRERKLISAFYFLSHTDEMGAAMRGVDAVAMPSRWEACPLLPMEAMVAGVPVIASDCIGMREVVEDTPALAFPSGDTDALAERIVEVAERRNDLRERAEQFRSIAAQRFDRVESARGLEALYRELLQ